MEKRATCAIGHAVQHLVNHIDVCAAAIGLNRAYVSLKRPHKQRPVGAAPLERRDHTR